MVEGCLRITAEGSLLFTHRHAFGEGGGDKPVSEKLASETLAGLKAKFCSVFSEPEFPIERDGTDKFEHRIRLKDESAPPPRRKIYPLDPTELAELRK